MKILGSTEDIHICYQEHVKICERLKAIHEINNKDDMHEF